MPSDGRVDENSSMSSLSRDRLLVGMRRQVKSAEATLQSTRAQVFFYLLVIAVCERQEGANTALEKIYIYEKKDFIFIPCT